MGGFDLGAAGSIASAGLSIAKSLGLGIRVDPALAHKFMVEIEGLIVGGFTDISGIEAHLEVEAIKEGGQNRYTEQRAKGFTFPNLVLKRGLTTADMLWLWYQDILKGNIKRRNGSIVLMTTDIVELWRWNFKDAYPVRWTGPVFKADAAAVAFETIELVHRGIDKDMGIGPLSLSGALSGSVSASASLL